MSGHINDILNELKEISPAVAGIPRNNVLSVPEHYFETLDAHVFFKINNKYAGVPEAYFETLPGHIMRRISKETGPELRINSFQRVFIRYAVAAVLTGLLGLALFSSIDRREEKVNMLYAEAKSIISSGRFDEAFLSLPEEEIESYLTAGGQDVHAALVAHVAYNKEIPDEMDYLSGESTLDELLKEYNIESNDN